MFMKIAKKFVLKLEVPGIEEKDLDVRVEDHTLTVKGERKFEKEEKEENFHRIERRYGSFYRAFTLPPTVDTENIAANYNAGVLKLELKKKPEAQPKQIKVNVDSEKPIQGQIQERTRTRLRRNDATRLLVPIPGLLQAGSGVAPGA